jgi:hypothetical protein
MNGSTAKKLTVGMPRVIACSAMFFAGCLRADRAADDERYALAGGRYSREVHIGLVVAYALTRDRSVR